MKEISVVCVQSYPLESVVAFTFDEFTKTLYVITKDRNIRKYQYNNKSLQFISEMKVSEELPNAKVICFNHIVEFDGVVIVYRNGSIVRVKDSEVENMGQFECQISSAAWSPSQEQLIVACGDGKLVQFDGNLDPVKEIIIEGMLDADSTISFKNDGKYFSLIYSVAGGRIAQTYDINFEVFQSQSKADPEGGLVQNVFEKGIALENLVAWQPGVGYIGGVMNKQVVFWEKNGLRHLEFVIREEGQVLGLKWSPDGHILQLQYSDRVSLYLRQNYQWYLKKTIVCPNIVGSVFLERQECQTLGLFEQDKLTLYWLNYSFNQGYGMARDFKSIKLTDYSRMIVPPPLSDKVLQLDNQVELLYVNQWIFAYTIDMIVYLYDYDKLLGKVDVSCAFLQPAIAHKLIFVWDKECQTVLGSIILVVHEEGTDKIVEIMVSPQYEVLQVWRRSFSFPTQITCLCYNAFLTLHSRFGEKFHYYPFGAKEEPIQEYELTNTDNSYDIQIENVNNWFVTLKSNNKLILNNQLLSTECTSFAVYQHFLAFTANAPDLYHLLYIMDLNKSIIVDKKALNASNIERGSKILAITHFDRLILQVPRGNFEVLAPRVMSLYHSKELFKQCKYRQCYEMLRRHKLDMNLLFDFNPTQFLQDHQIIVQELTESFLQIFIQSLSNGVSNELSYALPLEQFKQINATIIEKTIGTCKINLICDVIISALPKDTHLLTIITAMLKKQPSEVEAALMQVMALKHNEQQVEQDMPPHLNPDTNKHYKKHNKTIQPEQALEFICWLADANKMYEVALGTYDFDLVKSVAKYTQKDPKEYLPQLERFMAIENDIDRKATVQLELKHYDEAISVLSKGTQEQQDRAIELMVKHERFRVGIECFNESVMLVKAKAVLGDYLVRNKQLHQASLAYESVGLFDKALITSLEAHDTKRVLQFNPSEQQLIEYVETLKSGGLWKDCGRVYEYMHKYEDAIHFYCKAEQWKRVAKCLRHSQVDISQALQLTNSIKSNQMLQLAQQFHIKHERLQVVQELKKERGILAPSQVQADFDTMSDMSKTSGMSKSSYTMSVNTGVRKKKQQKEKSFLSRNIKEGSPVEEEYLVEYLKDIQKQGIALLTSIKQFQNYLIFFNHTKYALELSNKARDFVKQVNKQIKSLGQLQFEELNPQVLQLYKLDDVTIEFTQQLDQLIK